MPQWVQSRGEAAHYFSDGDGGNKPEAISCGGEGVAVVVKDEGEEEKKEEREGGRGGKKGGREP